jgi:hypothetical protein
MQRHHSDELATRNLPGTAVCSLHGIRQWSTYVHHAGVARYVASSAGEPPYTLGLA